MHPDAIKRAKLLPWNEGFKKDCARISEEVGPLEPHSIAGVGVFQRRAEALVRDYGLPPSARQTVQEYLHSPSDRLLERAGRRIPRLEVTDLRPSREGGAELIRDRLHGPVGQLIRDGRLKPRSEHIRWRYGTPYFDVTVSLLTPWTTREDWEQVYEEVRWSLDKVAGEYGLAPPKGRRPSKRDKDLQRSLTWWQWHQEGCSPEEILDLWQREHPDDSGYPDSFDAVYDAVREIDRLMAPVVSSPEP